MTVFTNNPPGTLSTVITGVATTGLRNLSNNGCIMGAEIVPNATAPEQSASYRLTAKYNASVSPYTTVAQCWFITDVGNSGTYPTVNPSDASPPAQAPDFIFTWNGSAPHAGAPDILQSIPAIVDRPPWKHKIFFLNCSGHTTDNTGDTNTFLQESTVNELGT